MSNEFVRKTQWTILHAGIGKHDCILFRGAADQTHVAQCALIAEKSERPRWGDLRFVPVSCEIKIETLQADRARKVDGVGNRILICRIDSKELVSLSNLNRLANLPVHSLAALAFDPDAMNRVKKRLSAAVEYRQFELIELDDRVVDAGAHQC